MEALVCDSERRLRSPGEVEVVGFEAVVEGDAYTPRRPRKLPVDN